jgi:SAM-dependent methyltransferase
MRPDPRGRPDDGGGRRPTAYRQHVLTAICQLLAARPRVARALDFGCGDGWFAREMKHAGVASTIVGVDVKIWPGLIRPPVLFDGERLPFSDQAFDLTYAIDVLHHCPEPERALREVLRCTGRYFLIKDHSYRSMLGWCTLTLFDEIGNRRFGVPSVYHYQREWSWNRHLEAGGFALEQLVHPAPCHSGLLGRWTNHLQFIALWRREVATAR